VARVDLLGDEHDLSQKTGPSSVIATLLAREKQARLGRREPS
jgi:hypothetical protein